MTDPLDPENPSATKASVQAPSAVGGSVGWERAALEKLAFAALEEQRTARRWRTFVRLAWLVFLVTLVWIGLHRGGPSADTSTPHTALVEIKGEIASGAEASAEVVITAVRAAFEDEAALAVGVGDLGIELDGKVEVGPRTVEETKSSMPGLDIQLTPSDLRFLNLEEERSSKPTVISN